MNKKLLSLILVCCTNCFASEYSNEEMRDIYQASFRIHAYDCLKRKGNNFYKLYCKNNKGIFNSATKVIGKAVSDILTNNDKDYFYDKKNGLILFKVSPIVTSYTISNTNALLLYNIVYYFYTFSNVGYKTERLLNLVFQSIEDYYAKDRQLLNNLKISSWQVTEYINAVNLLDYIKSIMKYKNEKIWQIFKEHKLKSHHVIIGNETEEVNFHISFITNNTGKLKYRFKTDAPETDKTKSLDAEISELLQDIAGRDEMKISQNSEYFVKNIQQKNQDKVYEIISKFRFPSILNQNFQEEFKKKFPKRDLFDTFQTAESELEFLNEEIKKIEPEAEVFSITKSLYEMIAGYYVGTDKLVLNMGTQLAYKIKDSRGTQFKLSELFCLENYAKKANNSVTKACENHLNNETIKEIFWDINNFISINLKVTDVSQTFEDTLKLIKEGKCIFGDEIATKIALMIKDKCLCSDDEQIDNKQRDIFINFVKNIICCENQAQGYVLYHAYRTNEWTPDASKAYESTMSLSNGIFSGILDESGCALNLVLKNTNNMKVLNTSHLIQMQLSRRGLLENAYPIFIPYEHAVLATFGRGETHHPRTKISKVKTGATPSFWGFTGIDNQIKYGWKENETPEYFALPDPTTPNDNIDETVKHLLDQAKIVDSNGNYNRYLYSDFN